MKQGTIMDIQWFFYVFYQKEKVVISVIIIALFVAGFIGWNIGANDAANSMGTAVGARVRSKREAVILVIVFGFAGMVLIGGRVIETVGHGIVPLDTLDWETGVFISVAASMGAGLWVFYCTYKRLPVSTSHAIIGGLAGAGLGIGRVPIYWGRLGDVVLGWTLTPIGAAVFSYLFYKISCFTISSAFGFKIRRRIFRVLVTISGCYMAFNWGGNDLANVTGIISGSGIIIPTLSRIFGGVTIILGVATWGYRVMETVGNRITRLGDQTAFAAELGSALNVHIYNLLGLPVSTSHSIVGATTGIGIARGMAFKDLKVLTSIFSAWAITPFAAGILGYIIIKIIT